ncbi:hypothetical protein ACJX0J_037694, partial [Zea mays]
MTFSLYPWHVNPARYIIWLPKDLILEVDPQREIQWFRNYCIIIFITSDLNFECFMFWIYMCTIIQFQVIKFKPSFVISNQSYYLPYLHIIILL